jgi:hypothetical protein
MVMTMKKLPLPLVLLTLAGLALGLGAHAGKAQSPGPRVAAAQAPSTVPGGTITYHHGRNQVYRIAAREGATAENVSASLQALSAGSQDKWLNIAPDGTFLVLETERFERECVGWACLAVVAGDLSSGAVVRVDGRVIHPEGWSAVASGGNLVVYPLKGGSHSLDLWAVTRRGNGWSSPLRLTSSSPYQYNHQPAVSKDGLKVVFDCGNQPYGAEGTAICEVGVDGSGFRVVLTPADTPPGLPVKGALHHPDYAPDGSIVFEGSWDSERIWRLPTGARRPVAVTSRFGNDNSPCVLPDGRIVSLWLQRDGNREGVHEMKAMAADGSRHAMIVANNDVADVGLGCGP